MKTLTCDLCDATAEDETFEAWMEALEAPLYAGTCRCDERSEQDTGRHDEMDGGK